MTDDCLVHFSPRATIVRTILPILCLVNPASRPVYRLLLPCQHPSQLQTHPPSSPPRLAGARSCTPQRFRTSRTRAGALATAARSSSCGGRNVESSPSSQYQRSQIAGHRRSRQAGRSSGCICSPEFSREYSFLVGFISALTLQYR